MSDSIITARLGLDTSSFKNGLKDAGSFAGSTVKGIGALFGASGLASLGGAAASLVALTNKAVQTSAAIQDLSDLTGSTVENIQAIGQSAELNGSKIEDVAKAYQRMSQSVNEASTGNKKIAEAFQALNINLDSFSQLSPDEQFETLSKAIVNNNDQAKALNAAYDILGKTTLTKLHLTIKDLAENGFGGLIEKAKETNQIMGEESIKSLDRYSDKLKDFKDGILNLWAEILSIGAKNQKESASDFRDAARNQLLKEGKIRDRKGIAGNIRDMFDEKNVGEDAKIDALAEKLFKETEAKKASRKEQEKINEEKEKELKTQETYFSKWQEIGKEMKNVNGALTKKLEIEKTSKEILEDKLVTFTTKTNKCFLINKNH
jgi:hypothetical protein